MLNQTNRGIESVLSQVTRSITEMHLDNNTPESHTTIHPKVQNGDVVERQRPFINWMPQRHKKHSVPAYTNYWFAQSNPDYVDQEESDTVIPIRRRKSVPNPPPDIKEAMESCVTADHLKKTILERFSTTLTEGNLEGAHISMGRTLEYATPGVRNGHGDHYMASMASSMRMKRTRKAQWPSGTS